MSDLGDSHEQKRPPVHGGRSGIIGSAEGGNRTLIPGGNTILSRARLPVPPPRQGRSVSKIFESTERPEGTHSHDSVDAKLV